MPQRQYRDLHPGAAPVVVMTGCRGAPHPAGQVWPT